MIIKRIRNIRNRKQRKRKKVLVSYRVNYVAKKAVRTNIKPKDFIRFVKTFKDQKTTHIVVSFDDLNDKYFDLVDEFFELNFPEYHYFLAEHNEKRKNGEVKTAIHVILSRNIETGNLLNLNNREYYELKRKWFEFIKPHLKPVQQQKLIQWEKKFGTKRTLDPWQKEKLDELLAIWEKQGDVTKEQINKYTSESFKAVAKFLAEQIPIFLNQGNIQEILRILNYFNAEIRFIKGKRNRFYLVFKDKDIKIRINRLNPKLIEPLDNYLKTKKAKVTQNKKQNKTKISKIVLETKDKSNKVVDFIVLIDPDKNKKIKVRIGDKFELLNVKVNLESNNSFNLYGGTPKQQAYVSIITAKKLGWKAAVTDSKDKEFLLNLLEYSLKYGVKIELNEEQQVIVGVTFYEDYLNDFENQYNQKENDKSNNKKSKQNTKNNRFKEPDL